MKATTRVPNNTHNPKDTHPLQFHMYIIKGVKEDKKKIPETLAVLCADADLLFLGHETFVLSAVSGLHRRLRSVVEQAQPMTMTTGVDPSFVPYGVDICNTSIDVFAKRLILQLPLTIQPFIFVAAMIYLDRYILAFHKHPKLNLVDSYQIHLCEHPDYNQDILPLKINDKTVHVLFFVTILIAQQFWEDKSYSTAELSRIARIPVSQVIAQQLKVMSVLNFNLSISDLEWKLYTIDGILEFHKRGLGSKINLNS